MTSMSDIPPKNHLTARRMRPFGTIRQLPSGRYQARYRPNTTPKINAARTFDTRAQAEQWLQELKALVDSGKYHEGQQEVGSHA